MRHHLIIAASVLLMATAARAGDSVINMPPPPKKAPVAATSPEEPAAQSQPTVGDIALYRYDRSRVGTSYTSWPYRRNGYYGPTSYGNHYHPYYYPYGFGFYGYGHNVFHGTLLGGHPFFFGGHTTVTFH